MPEELVSCSDCGRSGESNDSQSCISKRMKSMTDRNDNTLPEPPKNGCCPSNDYGYSLKSYSEDDFNKFVESTRLMEPTIEDELPHVAADAKDDNERLSPLVCVGPPKYAAEEIRKSSRRVGKVSANHKRPNRKKSD